MCITYITIGTTIYISRYKVIGEERKKGTEVSTVSGSKGFVDTSNLIHTTYSVSNNIFSNGICDTTFKLSLVRNEQPFKPIYILLNV